MNSDIIKYPDYRLRKISKEIKKIDDKIINILNNMVNIMDINHGIGLAASQIGIFKRIILVKKKNKNLFFINPIIKKYKKFNFSLEGCLSILDFYHKIKRNKFITIDYLNLFKKKNISDFKSLTSNCIQHEIDHLDGILFIDHINIFGFLNFLEFILENYEFFIS